jgi:putative FmdB family regulatory protein
MPIYEYQCGTCGSRLEVLQGLNDAPLTDCPDCGQSALTKLISVSGFQLKGSGWYKSDYARKPVDTGSKSETSEGQGSSCGQGACAACATD